MAETSASPAGGHPVAPGPETTSAAPRDARLFWWSNTADALGSQTSGVVLPLLLLGLGYSSTAVGVVVGASVLLGLVLGPLAAVPADRGARKPVMVWSASVSALAMAGVAAAVATGRPPLVLVLLGVWVERFSTAVYEAASRGTVAMITPPEGYARTVARLEVGERLALVLGPVLGGALYQLGRALPFVVDAASYVATAVCVRSMHADLRAPHESGGGTTVTEKAGVPGDDGSGGPPPRTSSRSPARGELSAGLRLVAGSAILRLVLLWTSVVNGVLAALYFSVLLTLQTGGQSGAATGAVLAVAGAAGIAGALAAPALALRLGAARSVLAVTWLLLPLTAALATTRSPWWDAVLFGAICLIMPVATVVLQSRAIAAVPPHLQARAGAVLATGAGGAAALGPAAAGVLAAAAGTPGPALGCASALLLLAAHTSWAHPRTLANRPTRFAGSTGSTGEPGDKGEAE
ncbi:MFS transporter [Streptomyces sp. NPDC048669]|uniref:MFS transporter n=1 Tax=Streptomyces sp. NPDC048669 TaxID=3155267 RepID=UPI00343CE93C